MTKVIGKWSGLGLNLVGKKVLLLDMRRNKLHIMFFFFKNIMFCYLPVLFYK